MNETVEKVNLFIGGEIQPSSTSSYFDDLSPETYSLWKLAAEANSHDVNKAVINADNAWRHFYSQSTSKDREIWLQNAADILERDKVLIAKQISHENGSPIIKAKAEVEASISYIRGATAFVNMTGELGRRTKLKNSILIREQIPIGVCVTITPFSNPLFSAVELSAGAMALGNTVVSLSSEFTPNTSLLLAKIYDEAGFPAGAYNQLSASTEEIVEQLVSHPMVQAVLYSGMAAEGMYLSDMCSRLMKRVLVDLDYTNTTFLMNGADIELAAKAIARNCFFYQGQGKDVTTRVICNKKIFPKFVELLKNEAEIIQKEAMGDVSDEQTWIGPSISQFFIDHIDLLLEDARKKGVRVVSGGLWQGNRLRPTILTDVTPEMSIFRSIPMGPIISVYQAMDMDEAVSMVNDSSSDFSVSVWSDKPSDADIFYKKTTASFVYVNMLPNIMEFESSLFFNESVMDSNNTHIHELMDQKVRQVSQ